MTEKEKEDAAWEDRNLIPPGRKTYSEKFNMPPIAELKGVIRVIGKLNSILDGTRIRVIGKLNSILDGTRIRFCGALQCVFNNKEAGCRLKTIEISTNSYPPTCEMYMDKDQRVIE